MTVADDPHRHLDYLRLPLQQDRTRLNFHIASTPTAAGRRDNR
jgi:hypothetical protein